MKKLLYIVLFCFFFSATAQEYAPNFFVTDIDGQTHELYEYLGQGKYVVVEFMGTWCGPCQGVAPDVGQGFIDFGCNYNDVVFISIDTGSDTQACIDFEEEFMPGVHGLPMVSGTDGGGDAAHNTYGITGVPTIVTISPLDTTYTETHLGFYGVLAATGIPQSEPWEGCQLEDYTAIIYGCTDTVALNYNLEAVIDDGLCLYDDMLEELEESVSNDSPDIYAYFSYLIDSLSNQIQILQESLSTDLVEEEVVSNANSFDVLNPLSYNGEFEMVYFEVTSETFDIPEGKSLIVQSMSEEGNACNVYVNGVNLMMLGDNWSYGSVWSFFNKPFILGSDDEITIGCQFIPTVHLNGILINRNIETIYHDLNSSDFIVPENKILMMTHLSGEMYADGNFFMKGWGTGFQGSQNLTIPISSGKILSSDESCIFHGYLVNNSNYTYATDYELIDALNEGMDSLSTLSEIVVQENDSISSENAILLEDNEALMLIDYNYDSLQYVTEYLYSQVFDLQQELLVPNIDVDMAIGWNMIGFSCPEEKELTDALGDIVDEVLIMKDNNGSVYIPEFGFNGIGDLTPGHGYQLKVTNYILDFNICE